MKRLLLLFLLTALGLSCFRTTPPVIEVMIADPDSVYPGDTVNLGFIAPFGNKDVLHFEWSCASGRIILPTFPAKSYAWVASEVPGDYFIKLKVSIDELETTDSIKVVVLDTVGTFTDARDGHQYKFKPTCFLKAGGMEITMELTKRGLKYSLVQMGRRIIRSLREERIRSTEKWFPEMRQKLQAMKYFKTW